MPVSYQWLQNLGPPEYGKVNQIIYLTHIICDYLTEKFVYLTRNCTLTENLM